MFSSAPSRSATQPEGAGGPRIPVVSLKEVLGRAFEERYGVAAFNVVNDVTLQAVLTAAVATRAPVIVQTSVKTVRMFGANVLGSMFREMAQALPVPATLHLDHCPDREIISLCIANGWNSVLFDGSGLSVDENTRQTTEVVHEAHEAGVDVEGEIEGITGVEDDVGSPNTHPQYALDIAVDFIRTTGIDCFAPAIGNAHGVYHQEPQLDAQRVSDIVTVEPIPIVLHGGTGLAQHQFDDLIRRGCAKVNISTALKIAYIDAHKEYLGAHPGHARPARALHPRPHSRPGDGSGPYPPLRRRRQSMVNGLIFDCDGVLADTERYGHLPAFNQMFREFGIPVQWTPEEYGKKLAIGGGKERMMSIFTDEFVHEAGLPSRPRRPIATRRTVAHPKDGDLYPDGRGWSHSASTGRRSSR